MINYLKRFKNTGTIVALVGMVGLLLNQFGYGIDLEWLNITTQILCSIFVVLGICNNPEIPGIDLPVKELE